MYSWSTHNFFIFEQKYLSQERTSPVNNRFTVIRLIRTLLFKKVEKKLSCKHKLHLNMLPNNEEDMVFMSVLTFGMIQCKFDPMESLYIGIDFFLIE